MSDLSDRFGRSRDALQQRDAAGLRQFARPRIWHWHHAPSTSRAFYITRLHHAPYIFIKFILYKSCTGLYVSTPWYHGYVFRMLLQIHANYSSITWYRIFLADISLYGSFFINSRKCHTLHCYLRGQCFEFSGLVACSSV